MTLLTCTFAVVSGSKDSVRPGPGMSPWDVQMTASCCTSQACTPVGSSRYLRLSTLLVIRSLTHSRWLGKTQNGLRRAASVGPLSGPRRSSHVAEKRSCWRPQRPGLRCHARGLGLAACEDLLAPRPNLHLAASQRRAHPPESPTCGELPFPDHTCRGNTCIQRVAFQKAASSHSK